MVLSRTSEAVGPGSRPRAAGRFDLDVPVPNPYGTRAWASAGDGDFGATYGVIESMVLHSANQRIIGNRRLLALLLLLALVLVACKATLLPLPGLHPVRIARWSVRLAVVSSADMAFVLALGISLWAVMKAARRLAPRRTGWFWTIAWTAVIVSAVYGVAAVPVFRHLKVQLTYPMLEFLGGWREMAISVRAVVSWRAWLVLAATVAAFVPAYRITLALLVRRPLNITFFQALGLGACTIGYFAFSFYWSSTQWRDRSLWQARVARSPHLRLLKSLVASSSPVCSVNFPADAVEFDDFRSLPDAHSARKRASEDGQYKNVFLVVLESVGAGYLGLYGAPYDNTPNLEALAEHALVFDNIYAQSPSSAKALVAMLCGVYPRIDWREQTGAGRMPVPSLADVLKRYGFRTGLFHSGSWAWRRGEEFLRSHGFDHLRDARDLPQEDLSWGTRDRWLLDEAFAWIDREDSPFFALTWTIQTHHPYAVEGRRRDYGVSDPELNRYLNAIRESDQLIGRIWQALERRGLADSTLLVVIGDHGEAFGQHDQRLHIFGVYEENVHVPLVIVHRDKKLPVGRRRTVGQQIDLAATIAQCVGVTPAPAWQGRSLLDRRRPDRAYFYTVWDPVILGIRQGRFKYSMELGRGERGEALYDLGADPGERWNIAQDHPSLRAALKRRVHALVAFEKQWRQGPPLKLGRLIAAKQN